MSNPAVAEQLEREEVIRWSKSLPRARVLRWGGMISTPDENLQVGKIGSPFKLREMLIVGVLLCQ